MKLNSIAFGSAFLIVGLIVLASAGAAGDGDMLQESLNALLVETSPFHSIAMVGFFMSLLGAILAGYWMLFGGSSNSTD
ncbi:hypothetical protein [Escherichia coli]|uniref:hypothetical protein n=1 Tax=Escherichia coli TaxID=562 RepID=UPI000F644542|nr:hypothetical protein [Escherichia coli]EDT5719916.1 hypothetical protein [Salmonella enterica subsp. enterica serovar Chester]EEB5205320.1 hypothetical protein [Salmonella enterica]EFT7565449.1 hypothetical protein [Salmonella enterica]EHC8092757.1 hypothetical protein [Salmonella enterica]RRM87163.1 hypothetical protein DU290_26055 [Escherichia coli]